MASTDFYLKIDTIDGESTKKGFEKQIEIDSFSFAESQAASSSMGTGGGAGKIQMQPFQFTTTVNSASPKLFLACATGQHIPKAVLTARKAGGAQESYLKYTLTNILITSFQTVGHGGQDALPVDTFTISFEKIETEYKPQDEKGKLGAAITTGYDLKKMEKV